MNKAQFIFSNRLPTRISRHVIFWLAWWIFFWLTYWFPSHWFPGWHPQGRMLLLARTNFNEFVLFVLSKSFPALLKNILFTYLFVYVLAPLFLWKEKYGLFIFFTAVLLVLFITQQYFALLDAYQALQQYDSNRQAANPDKLYLFRCAWENILFNCPATGGIFLGIMSLKRWQIKQLETQQVEKEKTTAELQLLKAQVHPHFLFNTLNNIYSFTLQGLPQAPDMIKKLSSLLQYIIHDCNKEEVFLEEEINMIRDYISLESIRYGKQLSILFNVHGDFSNRMIAPLLLLPLVENSFKHGTSKMLTNPIVRLEISIEADILRFELINSKIKESDAFPVGGIGLRNVRKRLNLLYPNRHQLTTSNTAELFTVSLEITVGVPKGKALHETSSQKIEGYEMA